MKAAGIAFDEIVIPLYEPGSREQILKYSRPARSPILIDGDAAIWETLAILEYLAEKFPQAHLWPAEARARGQARAVASEMHAGFQALRRNCPMNLWLPPKPRPVSDDAMADVRRIEALWSDCRARFGNGGPFLFGAFGAADAMYAPVVARFYSYRHCGWHCRPRLYGCGHGAAGLGGVARGGIAGALDHAAQRAGLAIGARGGDFTMKKLS